jgi:short-subunit dehydrogenase
MSTYFVTGATGFLGSRMVDRLTARPDCTAVYVLVRARSRERLERMSRTWTRPHLVVPVLGDLTEPGLGVDLDEVPQPLDHILHFAAVYDLTTNEQANRAANVEGTRHVIAFAGLVGAKWLHHISSVAVAGAHPGTFTEADFDLGQPLPSPYHATKFEAERLVREQNVVPWKVYRPSAVVGDSRTGEMDKIDGPYFFLPAITRLAALPARLPLVMPDLGATNIVPVDYVVDATEHLMHVDAPSGTTYHLVSPEPQPLSDVYNAMAAAVGAPKVVATMPGLLSTGLRGAGRALAGLATAAIDRLPGGRRARHAVLTEIGIPPEVLPHLGMVPTFDSTATQDALADTGLSVPPFRQYAPRLVRYWRDHLDPDRARRGAGRGDPLAGRRIVITGASSGIGRATAIAVAKRGAIALLVARREDELDKVRAEIVTAGGTALVYPCDLTDAEAVDALAKRILVDNGAVDMLVNNAGRSIRRSVALTVDRMHDYERTMALNYFAPLRLTLALLPHMRERQFGHVVNVTTMGLQTDTPRFSAYLASKAAIEEFGLVAGRELLGDNVTFTSVRMPLVRTPMIGPTRAYQGLPSISAEQAADMVVHALVHRPVIASRRSGRAAELATLATPKTARRVAHLAYRMMPESAPEARERAKPPLATLAAILTRFVWRKL